MRAVFSYTHSERSDVVRSGDPDGNDERQPCRRRGDENVRGEGVLGTDGHCGRGVDHDRAAAGGHHHAVGVGRTGQADTEPYVHTRQCIVVVIVVGGRGVGCVFRVVFCVVQLRVIELLGRSIKFCIIQLRWSCLQLFRGCYRAAVRSVPPTGVVLDRRQ